MSAVRRVAPSRRQPETWSLRQQANRRHPRQRGRWQGFAEHCSALPQPAGCAKPAVERGWGVGK